jgi:hypothetical protein
VRPRNAAARGRKRGPGRESHHAVLDRSDAQILADADGGFYGLNGGVD